MKNGYAMFKWCMVLAASFWLAPLTMAAQSTSANYSASPGLFASGSGQTSSANYQQTGVLGYWFARVGSGSANYQSGNDATPNAFTFADQSGVALATQITSAPVQISGINVAADWTATGGGTACVNSGNGCTCDVTGHAASGTIANNQYLCARHTSSASNFTATDTLITIGGASDSFTSTTLAAPVSGSSISGPTGAGTATANVAGGGNGVWRFTASGNGLLDSAGFIPVSGHPKSPTAPPPAGVSFPYGLFDFVLAGGQTGSAATITITYPAALPPGTVYWKFGPSPSGYNCSGAGCAASHWYQMPPAQAVIAGDTITLTITDGGVGDDDLIANGLIVDAGGPGSMNGPGGQTATAIPTLSELGVMLLAGMLGLFGMGFIRRRPTLGL